MVGLNRRRGITKEDLSELSKKEGQVISRLHDYMLVSIMHQARPIDEHTAQDLTQEAMMKLIIDCKKYDRKYAPKTFIGLFVRSATTNWRKGAWKRRVSSNQLDIEECLNKHQETDRRVWSTNGNPAQTIAHGENKDILHYRTIELMRTLESRAHPDSYDAWKAYQIRQMPIKAIAEEYKAPENTIKARIFRTNRLARIIAEEIGIDC